MPLSDPTDAALQRLTAYWQAYPLAADTLQGICRWWIADAAIAPARVEAALERLVGLDQVEVSKAADGRVSYRWNHADGSTGAAPS